MTGRVVCRYHPHSKLSRTIEKTPERCNVNVDQPEERTILRCTVIVDERTGRLCPFVEVEYDSEKVNERLCSRCGARLNNQTVLSQQCKECHSGRWRKRTKGRQRRRVGIRIKSQYSLPLTTTHSPS